MLQLVGNAQVSHMGMIEGGSGIANKLFEHNWDVAAALRPSRGPIKNQKLVKNATLFHEEWQRIDEAVIGAAQERMPAVADLMSRGLVYGGFNGMEASVLGWHTVGDFMEAQMDMIGVGRANNDRPNFEYNLIPLPITHCDFFIDARTLAISRKQGQPLDTTQPEKAGQKVAELIEQTLLLGSNSFTYGGGTIYGYLDHPNRNTGTLTENWDASAATGETILADVKAMKQALIDVLQFGPYVLYIPTAYETVLDGDFKDNSDKTIRQRILEVDKINAIQVADWLTADRVVLVQMQQSTARMIDGLSLTTVQWNAEGGMLLHYKVMAIQVPQIRAEQDGKCGLAVYSGT